MQAVLGGLSHIPPQIKDYNLHNLFYLNINVKIKANIYTLTLPSKTLILGIYLRSNTDKSIEDIFSTLELQKWDLVVITGPGKISCESLSMIMDQADEKRNMIVFDEAEMPKKFSHEKAFIFKTINYEDARWVQIEDLYNLKNSWDVEIGENDFTNSELNMLIEYWLTSECDMFSRLFIKKNKYITPNVNWVLSGVTYLVSKRLMRPSYIFLAKTTENRKKTVGMIDWFDGRFNMRACKPNEKREICTEWDGETTEWDTKKEYEILKLLNRKKELEDELGKEDSEHEKNEDEENQKTSDSEDAEKSGHEHVDSEDVEDGAGKASGLEDDSTDSQGADDDDNLKDVQPEAAENSERISKIELVLQLVQKDLMSYQVYFDGGIATIDN